MNTQKAIDFRSGPMDGKSVGTIPGVGREAAKKLISMGYTKDFQSSWNGFGINIEGEYVTHRRFADAIVIMEESLEELFTMLNDLSSVSQQAEHMYNKLKSFDFDEKKFLVWITMNCTGVHAATIYKALKTWYFQFEYQPNDSDSDSDSDSNSDFIDSESARAGVAGSGLMDRAGKKRKVQFDVPETECDNNSPVNYARRSNNPLAMFFSLILDSCNTILPEFHTKFQSEIFNVVRQFQERSRKRQSEDMPSTSHATDGGA